VRDNDEGFAVKGNLKSKLVWAHVSRWDTDESISELDDLKTVRDDPEGITGSLGQLLTPYQCANQHYTDISVDRNTEIHMPAKQSNMPNKLTNLPVPNMPSMPSNLPSMPARKKKPKPSQDPSDSLPTLGGGLGHIRVPDHCPNDIPLMTIRRALTTTIMSWDSCRVAQTLGGGGGWWWRTTAVSLPNGNSRNSVLASLSSCPRLLNSVSARA
jgi:hypothetical protein